MLKRLLDEIYSAHPAEFRAPGSPQDAARLLAQVTPRTSLSSFFSEAVVGAVSVERVSLRRHRPFLSSSFAPFFRGSFTVESGQTVLRGTFGPHPLVKGFVTLWFGFVGFFVATSLVLGPSLAADEGRSWWSGLLAGLGFAGAGLLIGLVGFFGVRFSKWLSRDDAEQMRRHITSALQNAA